MLTSSKSVSVLPWGHETSSSWGSNLLCYLQYVTLCHDGPTKTPIDKLMVSNHHLKNLGGNLSCIGGSTAVLLRLSESLIVPVDNTVRYFNLNIIILKGIDYYDY